MRDADQLARAAAIGAIFELSASSAILPSRGRPRDASLELCELRYWPSARS